MFTVHHEAVPNQGEDAEPVALEGRGGSFVLGVFDGLGGSGGTRYDIDGVERKGAYIASRLARKATEAVAPAALQAVEPAAGEHGAGPTPGAAFAERLWECLHRDFEEAANNLDREPTKLRSAMVRVLPTTAAIALVEPAQQDTFGQATRRAAAIWAGDSRVYVLTPHGLEQVSRDDTRADADAFTSLSTDPPIDNCISASEPFQLRRSEWELESPSVVITATDGCFGYFPTPAHFELVLLEALTSSPQLEECQRQLEERISAVARDDATMAVAIIDGGDFPRLQAALDERRSYVDTVFVNPYEWLQKQVHFAEEALDAAGARRDAQVEARNKCASELWDQYRSRYERLTAPIPKDKEGRDE